MNKLRTKFLFVSGLSLFLFSNLTNVFSAERDYGAEKFEKINKKFNTFQNPKCEGIIPYKNAQNRTMAVTLRAIDSLANSLSMGNDFQTPISKDPTSPNMALVMRGSHEVTEPDFAKSNSKNNLFLKKSTDDGVTWSTKELIYSNEDFNYGQARYPSCFVLNKGTSSAPDIEYLYTFSLVIESTGQWPGFATGLSGSLGNSSVPQETFSVDGKTYKWGTSFENTTTGQPGWSIADSRMAGWFDSKTSTNIFCVGPVSVPPAGDVNDNSAIGYRLINEDLATTYETIPAQWKSSVFGPTTSQYAKTSAPVNFRRTTDGKMYMAVFGNFGPTNELTTGKNSFSVSMSNDNGTTWSDMEIFPWDYIKAYAASASSTVDLDSLNLPYWSNDFIVHDNGDYSFYTVLAEFTSAKPRLERFSQIIELYKENGEFGVRLVGADLPHTWVPYTDNTGAQAGNAKSYELQVSKTADGQTIVAKWVELMGVTWPTDDSFQFMTSDIFVSKRNATENTWTPKINITNDDMLDRCVLLPDVLPNDLTKVPIFTVQTKGAPDVANQRLYLASQLIMAGTFDLTTVSVEDENEPKVQGMSIYPNPTTSEAVVTYNLTENANVRIVVSDNLGNEVISSNLNSQNIGLNYYSANLQNLSSGAYFVTIYANNKVLETKTLNVIK